MGVPFFTQSIAYQTYLLIPIIAIEAFIYHRHLKVSILRAITFSISANLVSTITGGLVLLVGTAILTTTILGYTPMISPSRILQLSGELMLSLIPLCVLSIIIEWKFGQLVLGAIAPSKLLRATAVDNGFTYLMLEILAIARIIRHIL